MKNIKGGWAMTMPKSFTFTLIQVIIELVVKATTLLRKKGKGIKSTSVNPKPQTEAADCNGKNFWSYNDRSIKIPHSEGGL